MTLAAEYQKIILSATRRAWNVPASMSDADLLVKLKTSNEKHVRHIYTDNATCSHAEGERVYSDMGGLASDYWGR